MGTVLLRMLCLVGTFPHMPSPQTSGGPGSERTRLSGSSFPKTMKSSTAISLFVLAALISKAISLDISRWQHLPPSALRLE